MRRRHSDNHNLTYHTGGIWNGLPVLTNRGPLLEPYLKSIRDVMVRALQEHPRTLGIRFDLHFPVGWNGPEGEVISRFIESLKARIDADLNRRRQERKDGRVHPCRLRYFWVKEQGVSAVPHYHVFIFLNRDAYFTLGSYKAAGQPVWDDVPPEPARANMAERIINAWASALWLPPCMVRGLVHFPANACHSVDVNAPDVADQFQDAFNRASYFAKAETKHYGDGSKKFGCSRG